MSWEWSFKNIFYKQRSRSFLIQFDKTTNQVSIPIINAPFTLRSQGAYRITIWNLDEGFRLMVKNTTGTFFILPVQSGVIDWVELWSEPYLPKDDDLEIWFDTDKVDGIGNGLRISVERYVKKKSQDKVLQY